MTLGLSISGAVFVNTAQNALFKLLPDVPRDQVSQLVSGTSGYLVNTLDNATRTKTIETIVGAWNNT